MYLHPQERGLSVVQDAQRSENCDRCRATRAVIDNNVFEGIEVKGLPRFTVTKGYVAVEENQIRCREGHGEFVPRESFPAVNRALSRYKEITSPRSVVRDPSNLPPGV